MSLATNPDLPKNAKAFSNILDLRVFSWDNKLPAAELLLSRFRIFLNPGYPYEDILSKYHAASDKNMCFLLKQFHFFNWTRGEIFTDFKQLIYIFWQILLTAKKVQIP